jgi:MoaA/NifB/PqqE/SkfB family radical SAM enzyme
VKLNWRGEPLLHPKLPKFVDYAKKKGILDVMINTNAVTLDNKKAHELIEAGLDLVIYSFDGGTAETYNKMRVGRFKENTFDKVYPLIQQFSKIRAEMNSYFPRTKIQMILTEDTYPEVNQFYQLFTECVDDVSVKAYTERGGSLSDLDVKTRSVFEAFVKNNNLPLNVAHWRDLNGKLFIATGRIPCEQPYQRLMVTYDGRVSMCCYDWGVEHPVGYVDEEAYTRGDEDYADVIEKVKKRAKGFELLSQVVMPKRYNEPLKEVKTLREIWHGEDINQVRELQVEGRAGEIAVCGKCPFKETYKWQEVKI